jgi:hypothetical protein
MAKKGRKKSKRSKKHNIVGGGFGHKMTGRRGRHPTAKAKKAYYKNIIKGYHRLKKVVSVHAPSEL